MLSAAQQERYARHLLLEELGGEGQERIAAGTAAVQLSAEAAPTALWAARYLAASGLGTLVLEGPWADAAADECAQLWPETRVLRGAAPSPDAVRIVEGAGGPRDVTVAARDLGAADAAALGARAALEALKTIARAGRPAALPLGMDDAP